MVRQTAYRLSLIAFATVLLRGLLAGAAFAEVLPTGLWALGGFFILGLIAGELARRLVEENVETELDRWKAARANREPESQASS